MEVVIQENDDYGTVKAQLDAPVGTSDRSYEHLRPAHPLGPEQQNTPVYLIFYRITGFWILGTYLLFTF